MVEQFYLGETALVVSLYRARTPIVRMAGTMQQTHQASQFH
jgi:hypothetical protein